MLHQIRSSRCVLLLVCALLLAAVVRLPHIDADPPAGDISRSGSFLADEGTHSLNALQWARTGHWYVPDSFNPAVNTPLFTLFQYGVMKLFGISLATVRYGAVFCGLASILLMYLLLRPHNGTADVSQDPAPWPGRQTGLGAGFTALLAAVNFPLFVYNRLAFIENLLLCFLVTGAILLSLYLHAPHRKFLLLAFCVVLVLGYLTKPSILFFAAVFFFLVWHRGAVVRRQTYPFTAISVVLLVMPLWLLWIHPHLDDWLHYQRLTIVPKIDFSPLAIAKNLARYVGHLKFFEFMPVSYVIALMMAMRGLGEILHRKQSAIVPRLLYLWFWIGVVFLSSISYSPPRYSLVLMPAILGLNGLFFAENIGKPGTFAPQKWPGHTFVFASLLISLQVAYGFYRIFAYRQVFLSCFLPVLGWLALYAIWLSTRTGRAAVRATWALLLMITLVQGAQIVHFHATVEYSLRNAIRGVTGVLQEHTKSERIVLAGDSALLLAFELRVPAIDIMYRQDRLSQLIKRARPNYLFLQDPAELARLQVQMPDYWRHVTVLARYPLMHNYTHGMDAILYRVEIASMRY